jgi:hypothetical protein
MFWEKFRNSFSAAIDICIAELRKFASANMPGILGIPGILGPGQCENGIINIIIILALKNIRAPLLKHMN